MTEQFERRLGPDPSWQKHSSMTLVELQMSRSYLTGIIAGAALGLMSYRDSCYHILRNASAVSPRPPYSPMSQRERFVEWSALGYVTPLIVRGLKWHN